MKKTFAGVMVAGLLAASMIGVASCASNNVDPTLNVNVDDEVKVSVIDWTDRTLGEVAAPQWLRNMRRGNSDTFKQSWGVDSNRVIKVSMATGKTEATAQALSRAGFAYTQAAELNQKVIGRVGQGLNTKRNPQALPVVRRCVLHGQ